MHQVDLSPLLQDDGDEAAVRSCELGLLSATQRSLVEPVPSVRLLLQWRDVDDHDVLRALVVRGRPLGDRL